MNAYLALTKYQGFKRESELQNSVRNSEKRMQFYEKTIHEFQNHWKRISQEWYKRRYDFYGTQIQPDERKRKAFLLKCSFPLVIGQGTHSVLETHLTMHSIYGMPYLPGSALKGIAAHYCHQVLGMEEKFLQGGEYAKTLFGTSERQGIIHYHDAWPVPDSVADSLCLDVLTPHHQAYYQGMDRAPRDDDSPLPIPFLAATGTFRVLLSCDDDAGIEWLEIAKTIVGQAIDELGIGGKTNAGYGRMEVIGSES